MNNLTSCSVCINEKLWKWNDLWKVKQQYHNGCNEIVEKITMLEECWEKEEKDSNPVYEGISITTLKMILLKGSDVKEEEQKEYARFIYCIKTLLDNRTLFINKHNNKLWTKDYAAKQTLRNIIESKQYKERHKTFWLQLLKTNGAWDCNLKGEKGKRKRQETEKKEKRKEKGEKDKDDLLQYAFWMDFFQKTGAWLGDSTLHTRKKIKKE